MNSETSMLTIKQKIPQYLAASTATLASLSAGCAIGWSSPLIERLTGITGTYEPFEKPLTEDDVSWVGSLTALGGLPGTLIGGLLIDRYGRKNTFILIGGIPAIIGWITILAAHNTAALFAGRFLIGVSAGSSITLGPVYIAEVSSASERGALCSMPQLMATLGVMLQYAVGPYVSYLVLTGLDLVFPLLFVCCFFFMPESPYYLLAKDKREEAEKSLLWFRGGGRDGTTDVRQELDRMALAIEESGIRDSKLLDSFKDVFATRGNRRAFLITSGLVFIQQFSGIMAVLFNAETILRGSGDKKLSLNASECAMIVGAVQIAASFVETFLADRAGRRPLLLLSCIFSSISLIALGVHAYLDKYDHSTALSLSWLPIVSLVVYMITYILGLGPLPWAVLSEVFPTSSKSAASILVGCFCGFLAFVVSRAFLPLINAAGAYGTYWLFGGCCAAGFVFLAIFLPETKCKTLEQIQKDLGAE